MAWMQPLAELLTLFLRSACPLCQRSTSSEFCPACQRQLKHCQLASHRELLPNGLELYAWGKYGGALRRSISALKYENKPQIARPLGQWLGQGWLALAHQNPHRSPGNSPSNKDQLLHRSSTPPIVVPIPLHPAKQRKRGYNQAELLAEGFCQVTGLKLYPQGLQRVRETEAQFALSADERAHNLAGAFSTKLWVRSTTSVLILDDIYTTGATAKAAIQAFQAQGITVKGLVVLARS